MGMVVIMTTRREESCLCKDAHHRLPTFTTHALRHAMLSRSQVIIFINIDKIHVNIHSCVYSNFGFHLFLTTIGILTTLTLSKWGVDRNSSSRSTRMPHIYDILDVLYCFRSIESSTSTQTCRSKHIVMTGTEAEAEAFMTLHPKFFFVSCRVLVNIRSDGGHGPFMNIVFPVIWKMGHYYVIVGEGDTPVYRIHHPDKFFFTFKGTLILKNLLSRYYRGLGTEFDFSKNDEGKHAPYYIPNFMIDDCPSERWDSAENVSIAKQLLLPLVHEPVVPGPHLASVQVIQMDDSHNIVDIKFPLPTNN